MSSGCATYGKPRFCVAFPSKWNNGHWVKTTNIAGSSIGYNPYHDEQGRLTRWYATGTDIEHRKRAEDRTRNENVALREEIDRDLLFEEIVGSSDAIRQVLEQVAKVAPTNSTVLISGETGTGKELLARAIHKRSKRASRAFIRVNC